MADSFRFKHFTVRHEASALKVGTDAVLLGAALTVKPTDVQALDIGCGCGVITLMVAQRLDAARVDPPIAFSSGTSPSIPPQTANSTADVIRTSLSGSIISRAGNTDATSSETAVSGRPSPIPSDDSNENGGNGNGSCLPHGRGTFHIEGIDADPPSVAEAAANFEGSRWRKCLSATHIALQDYRPYEDFDLIFSNPPYYDNSLPNPDARSSSARHTETLSYRDICAFAAEHLRHGDIEGDEVESGSNDADEGKEEVSEEAGADPLHKEQLARKDLGPGPCHQGGCLPLIIQTDRERYPNHDGRHLEEEQLSPIIPAKCEKDKDDNNRRKRGGRLALIIPADCEKDLIRTAASFGLYPFRLLRIRTTPSKPVRRLVAEFSRSRAAISEETLVLHDDIGAGPLKRSDAYRSLTEDFYL